MCSPRRGWSLLFALYFFPAPTLSFVIESGPANFTEQLLDHFDVGNKKRWSQPYYFECQLKSSGVDAAYVTLNLEGEAGPGWGEEELRTRRRRFKRFSSAASFPCDSDETAYFSLKHRFYTNAQPTGDLSLQSLRYHSSQQALADAARFVRHVIRGQFKLQAPIIVTGGSYPGALAAWFRLKYPHLAVGGIAYSPVIYAHADYAAFENVTLGVLRKEAPQCLTQLTKVYGEIRKKEKSWLFNELGLCLAEDVTVDNIVDGLWTKLTYSVNEEWVQYWQASQLHRFCNAFQANPYKALREKYVNPRGKAACVSPHKILKPPFPTGDWQAFACSDPPCLIQRAWWWQKCAEFGWFKTNGAAPKTFFFYSMEEFFQTCESIYLLSRNDVEENVRRTNEYYGGRNISSGSNLLIVNGEYDPWHAVSLAPNHPIGVPLKSTKEVISVMVPRSGHCPADAPAVRLLSANLIKSWIQTAPTSYDIVSSMTTP